MSKARFGNNTQQSLLYLLTAAALAFALRFELLEAYRPNWLSNAPLDILRDIWQLWFLVVSLLVFFLGAIISLFEPRHGATIAFIASLIGFGYSLTRSCVFVVFYFPLLFLPVGFATMVFPPILLYLSCSYSRQVIRAKEPVAGPLHWLMHKASSFTKGLALLTLVACGVYLVIDVTIAKTRIETYPMTWSDTSNSRCNHEITLGFVNAYGYKISTCSADLQSYLRSARDKTVEVAFEINYSLGMWKYRVQRVGEWTGAATFEGLMWSCSSSDVKCSNATNSPPFRQPYSLH